MKKLLFIFILLIAFVNCKNSDISNFATLEYAKSYGHNHKGMLFFKLKFNQKFEKEILYVVVNLTYKDKYDNVIFNENQKITDEVAHDFKGTANLLYDDSNTPFAEGLCQIPYRDTVENKALLKQYLKVRTLAIVFKDKTKIPSNYIIE